MAEGPAEQCHVRLPKTATPDRGRHEPNDDEGNAESSTRRPLHTDNRRPNARRPARRPRRQAVEPQPVDDPTAGAGQSEDDEDFEQAVVACVAVAVEARAGQRDDGQGNDRGYGNGEADGETGIAHPGGHARARQKEEGHEDAHRRQ